MKKERIKRIEETKTRQEIYSTLVYDGISNSYYTILGYSFYLGRAPLLPFFV